MTSPGGVRFAPHRGHSGMPRLFTATASLRLAMLRPRACALVRTTLCALRLGEPHSPRGDLTPAPERTPFTALPRDVARVDRATLRAFSTETNASVRSFRRVPADAGTESLRDDAPLRALTPFARHHQRLRASGPSTAVAQLNVPKHRSQSPRPRARRLSPVKALGGDDTRFTPRTSRAWSSAPVHRELFEAHHRCAACPSKEMSPSTRLQSFQFSMSTRVSVDSHSSADPSRHLSERFSAGFSSSFFPCLPSVPTRSWGEIWGLRSITAPVRERQYGWRPGWADAADCRKGPP